MEKVTSITAAKAERSNNAADWTPRDCLQHFIEKMDEGIINPEGLIICFYETGENGGAVVKFSNAMPNVIMAAGTLDRALHALSPPATPL